MGEFVDGAYRPGPTAEDALHAGLPAGVRERGTEPCARRDLIEKAKQLIPANGPRERGTEPKAPLEGYSAGDQRRITAAAEFVASLDGEQAGMYRD